MAKVGDSVTVTAVVVLFHLHKASVPRQGALNHSSVKARTQKTPTPIEFTMTRSSIDHLMHGL